MTFEDDAEGHGGSESARKDRFVREKVLLNISPSYGDILI